MATPIDRALVSEGITQLRISDVGRASIREIRRLIDWLEERQPTRFIRMEMGIPGLPADQRALDAERRALESGVAALYPPVAGIPSLKREISRFLKNFADVDVSPEGCIPTVGSVNGSFLSFLVAGRARSDRDTILLLNPGFPLHAAQAKMLGLTVAAFDVYDFRGDALEEQLDRMAREHGVAAMLYSNPNNPAWICFTETELEVIARVADRHDIVIIEDLAYFAMDFRTHIGRPGVPPFQPTVAHYSDRWIQLVSSSKAFSYAGQRVGMLAMSDTLRERSFPDLRRFYPYDRFGDALVLGALYTTSAGTAHSAQYGLAALLEAANSGELDFVDTVRVYGEKAARMKRHFAAAGFSLVYDRDGDEPIADGFYFTVSYRGMSGEELVAELIPYGISAISLGTTGSTRTEGIRACVSLVPVEMIDELGSRLQRFHKDHSA